MIERRVRIRNDLGIHLRAAGVVVQVAGKFEADIWLERDGARATAKSIMSVLSLAAGRGVELKILASGTDADQAVAAIADLIEGGFEE